MGTLHRALPRLVAATLADRLARSPVVIVTGARQTGKTTLVRAAGHDRSYVTLDSLSVLDRARSAPDALIDPDHPMTIDEVQRAPDVMLAIKRRVDEDRKPGQFLLTGSANLALLRRASESLAGRAVHITLRPMTLSETQGHPASVWDALLGARTWTDALAAVVPGKKLDWRAAALAGGLPPAALARSTDNRHIWLEGYVDTFLQRDVRDLANLSDLSAFLRFTRLVALRNGALLNYADLARDTGVPRTTAQRWLGLLDALCLITLLPPFSASKAKRLIRSPKVYFFDTGLALYLAGVDDAGGIDELASPGTTLEAVVLNELLAWRETLIRKPAIYFWRTAGGQEIDLVVESGRRLLPIEVKSARSVRSGDARAIDAFCDESGSRAPFGVVLYDGHEAFRLSDSAVAIPLGALASSPIADR